MSVVQQRYSEVMSRYYNPDVVHTTGNDGYYEINKSLRLMCIREACQTL